MSSLLRSKSENISYVCGERGSNTRPSDLQSNALPTELSLQLCYRGLMIYIIQALSV
ncbi:hypothetical protein NC653_001164 [Populus alba x Populus x berolinensis]|uniref:Uncharacterized protein n=1 Tax=Populus alba x Populus x berolinensis TaxID=444605 RepID=A0AAD6RKB7_9ROSI|nr:hypothetical protein NC653_001164 [Populus alba x Populus x berolinensis]